MFQWPDKKRFIPFPVIFISLLSFGCFPLKAIAQSGKAALYVVSTDSIFWSPKLLNSERIELKFGSYGVELLYQDADTRLTNLYSLENGDKVMRTFAFVQFPAFIDTAFQQEHEEILNGGSIGAVFKQNGWIITKRQLFSGNMLCSEECSKLKSWMGAFTTDSLAMNIYSFEIEKEGRSFHYAIIAEVYHPDYLQTSDLDMIVGHVNKADQVSDIIPSMKSAIRKLD